LGFFNLFGFTGTGLAHPKCTKKIIIVPNRSRCASGFKVKRPFCFAVSSPYLFATKACAYSWNVNANKIGGAIKSSVCIFIIPYLFRFLAQSNKAIRIFSDFIYNETEYFDPFLSAKLYFPDFGL
jgi:hypothetical protein